MGLLKSIKGMRYLTDAMHNKEKKEKFKQAKQEKEVDIFESPDIYFLRMEEKAGMFGKRSFTITNPTGDIVYTARKSRTFKHPIFHLYDNNDNEVGLVKPTWSLYKPLFNIETFAKSYTLKQTTVAKNMYELEDCGWQIQSQIGKTIVCDKKWTKIIQIEWENTTLSNRGQTDVYKVKMQNEQHQTIALLLALAIYISRRPEYQ